MIDHYGHEYWLTAGEERLGGEIWQEFTSQQGYSGVAVRPFHALIGFCGWLGVSRSWRWMQSRKAAETDRHQDSEQSPEGASDQTGSAENVQQPIIAEAPAYD